MNSISALRNTVNLTEHVIEALPNHKRKSAKEWSSSCPQCNGEDRFLFWPAEGNYWCRQCDLSGFIGQQTQSTLTDDQLADIEKHKRVARQEEIDRKRTALETLQARGNDLTYHRNLNGNTKYVKRHWGLSNDTIDLFKVGYCHACPTSPYSDSITIPYYWNSSLINLRHRLSSPNGQGKYRPEAKGLPTAIFNADALKDDMEDHIILVEGEFKVMVLQQYGLPAIGIPGASNDKLIQKCLKLFPKTKTVYVVLDPGAEVQALKIATMLSGAKLPVKLVTMPTKPDDFFTLYGGTYDQFYYYLTNGRKI